MVTVACRKSKSILRNLDGQHCPRMVLMRYQLSSQPHVSIARTFGAFARCRVVAGGAAVADKVKTRTRGRGDAEFDALKNIAHASVHAHIILLGAVVSVFVPGNSLRREDDRISTLAKTP